MGFRYMEKPPVTTCEPLLVVLSSSALLPKVSCAGCPKKYENSKPRISQLSTDK